MAKVRKVLHDSLHREAQLNKIDYPTLEQAIDAAKNLQNAAIYLTDTVTIEDQEYTIDLPNNIGLNFNGEKINLNNSTLLLNGTFPEKGNFAGNGVVKGIDENKELSDLSDSSSIAFKKANLLHFQKVTGQHAIFKFNDCLGISFVPYVDKPNITFNSVNVYVQFVAYNKTNTEIFYNTAYQSCLIDIEESSNGKGYIKPLQYSIPLNKIENCDTCFFKYKIIGDAGTEIEILTQEFSL